MAKRSGLLDSIEAIAFVSTLIPNPYTKAFGLLTGLVISSLPVKKPKGMEQSQSYGWEHTANKTSSSGTPMPVIYGKTRVKPVLKNRYIAMEGDRQWLYALYSFAGHGIDLRTVPAWSASKPSYVVGDEVREANHPGQTYICKYIHIPAYTPLFIGVDLNTTVWRVGPGIAAITDIEISGNPIANYDPAACQYETRPGTPLQQIIDGFHVTYQNNPQGTALKPFVKTWFNYIAYDVDDIVEYPAGGGTAPSTLYICVATPAIGTLPTDPAYWALLGSVTVPKFTDWKFGLGRGFPNNCFTQTTVATAAGTRLLVDLLFPNGLFSIAYGDAVQCSVLVFVWYKKATEDWNAAIWANADDFTITKNTTKAFHYTITWPPEGGTDKLDEAAYDVRILYSVPFKGVDVHITPQAVAELSNVASLVYAPFTYPGEPLLGLRVLATEKLQGDIEVTGVCERSQVWVYDTTIIPPAVTPVGWVKKPANNHAWAVYDLLAQGNSAHPTYDNPDWTEDMPSYGCGIPYDRIDYVSFKAWADFIDSLNPDADGNPLGYKLNIVFDDFMSIWDAITIIAFEGRGAVLPYGAKYYAVPDKPDTPVHLICEGNIVAGSLTQAWGDKSKRVNSIEVTYKDENRSYDDVTFIARTEEWFESTSLTDAMRQTLYGTTTFAQAYRIAKYLLNCNEALARVVNLEMDVEGLDVMVGDVVNLQHAAMGLGTGGRIVKYEENLLDNPSFDLDPVLGWDFPSWDPWDDTPSLCRARVVIGQTTVLYMDGNPGPLPQGGTKLYSGNASWFHYSSNVNFGLQQTVTVKPSTTYTISAHCWITSDIGGVINLRVLSHNDQAGISYVQSLADPLLLKQWQVVVLTLTTAADQTQLTIWIGAVGQCFWDSVMVEEANEATDWNYGSRVTIDRDVTLDAAKSYAMTMRNSAGMMETHTGIHYQGAANEILFFERWTEKPDQYAPYAFGIEATYAKLFRVIEVRRGGDMRKRLTLLEYDGDVYRVDDDLPSQLPDHGVTPGTPAEKPAPEVFNVATNLTLSEFTSLRPTGEYQSNIVVTWTPADMAGWGQWEVLFMDVDAADPNWVGEWAAGTYDAFEKVTHGGHAYISLIDGNTGEPFSI